jgi:hypothetical protein
MVSSLRLTLGSHTAEFRRRADLAQPDGVVLTHIEVGLEAMGALFFKGDALNAASLERAIEWTEDRIQVARAHLPLGAALYTSEADLHELARVSGVPAGSRRELHRDAVEQTFSRLVMQAMGQSSPQELLPAMARFYATVVLVRELMHHLHFPLITVLDELEMAKGEA